MTAGGLGRVNEPDLICDLCSPVFLVSRAVCSGLIASSTTVPPYCTVRQGSYAAIALCDSPVGGPGGVGRRRRRAASRAAAAFLRTELSAVECDLSPAAGGIAHAR